MPLRIPNDSLPRDVLQYCIAPTASQALLFAGAAKVFTTINPVNAAAFGIVWTITDYVLDKLMPDCIDEDPYGNALMKECITCLSSYPIAAAATNALGYSLTISEILALSAGITSGVLGVGVAVYFIATRFFAASNDFGDNLIEGSTMLGSAFPVGIGVLIGDRLYNCVFPRNSGGQEVPV